MSEVQKQAKIARVVGASEFGLTAMPDAIEATNERAARQIKQLPLKERLNAIVALARDNTRESDDLLIRSVSFSENSPLALQLQFTAHDASRMYYPNLHPITDPNAYSEQRDIADVVTASLSRTVASSPDVSLRVEAVSLLGFMRHLGQSSWDGLLSGVETSQSYRVGLAAGKALTRSGDHVNASKAEPFYRQCRERIADWRVDSKLSDVIDITLAARMQGAYKYREPQQKDLPVDLGSAARLLRGERSVVNETEIGQEFIAGGRNLLAQPKYSELRAKVELYWPAESLSE